MQIFRQIGAKSTPEKPLLVRVLTTHPRRPKLKSTTKTLGPKFLRSQKRPPESRNTLIKPDPESPITSVMKKKSKLRCPRIVTMKSTVSWKVRDDLSLRLKKCGRATVIQSLKKGLRQLQWPGGHQPKEEVRLVESHLRTEVLKRGRILRTDCLGKRSNVQFKGRLNFKEGRPQGRVWSRTKTRPLPDIRSLPDPRQEQRWWLTRIHPREGPNLRDQPLELVLAMPQKRPISRRDEIRPPLLHKTHFDYRDRRQ